MVSCSQMNIQIKQSSVKPLASVPPQWLSPARGTGFYCSQLSFPNSAKENIFAPTKPQLLWDQRSRTQGCFSPVPSARAFPRVPSTAPGRQRRRPHLGRPVIALARTGMAATFCVTLKHPSEYRRCSSLQGCGSAPYPRPLGEKGSCYSDIQKFEGFPWPNSLLPAITAVTGKGIVFLEATRSAGSVGKRQEASPHPVDGRGPLGFVLAALLTLTPAALQPCSCPKA